MTKNNTMTDEEFVLYRKNGHIMSGGYRVDNALIQNSSALVIKGGANKAFFTVPAVLSSFHRKISPLNNRNFDKQEGGAAVIGMDLHSRLLEAAAPQGGRKRISKKRKSKKRISKKRKSNTRKKK